MPPPSIPRRSSTRPATVRSRNSSAPGPYRFVEHKPDRHIKLARFKEYAARTGRARRPTAASGVAYVDEILFIPVPDVAVRLAGVETGEYHYAQSIKQDQYDRVKCLPALEPGVVKPDGWITAVPNHKQGVMANKKIRQAFQAALDMEPIMAAGIGNKDFYRVDGALFFPEQPNWHSTAGVTGLQPEERGARPRRSSQEAGYKGEPVRWITTREYEWMYKTALVAKQQLEEAGFTVDLQVLDWATLVQRRNKPELYEIFSTGFTFAADPALATCRPVQLAGLVVPGGEGAAARRAAPRDRPQEAQGPDRPASRPSSTRTSDASSSATTSRFDVTRKELRGFHSSPYVHFWNAWLTK